jgi:NADH dehydrogenase
MNDAARNSSAFPASPRVVVLGGGFGGLLTARGLAKAKARVTLIDRRNHHLFQPLLYQVATGGLSPANIAAPLRSLVKSQANTEVLLHEIEGIDAKRKMLFAQDGSEIGYDYLVVATGAGQSYFGNNQWAATAPGLKSLEDATRIRRDVLLAYEHAELESDPLRRKALLTFVVVGAGPTGVELAGTLAEVARRTLAGEFRSIDPASARVMLVEGADRVLPPFQPQLSAYALEALTRLGVEVRLGWKVTHIEPGRLELQPMADKNVPVERLEAANILWAAGVEASPFGRELAAATGAELDRVFRVKVGEDCSVAGHPEIFVIGDLAHYVGADGKPLPGLAPVAMQQGRFVAKLLRRRLAGKSENPKFSYLDKGSMAVIGRRMAVAQMKSLRFRGGIAWLAWLFIHLMYLAEFQNRVLVLFQWAWNYVTRNRSARLITGDLPPKTEKPKPS